MSLICERSFPTDTALKRVEEIFKKMNLTVLEDRHESSYSASHIVVKTQGGFVSSGSGKGLHHRIGARAECIEHFVTQTELAKPERFQMCHETAAQDGLQNDGIVQSLLQFDDTQIPVVPMKRIATPDGEEINIPHVLLNPDMLNELEADAEVNGFLGKYSSNTGTAFGLDATEAQLHALMESIERHTQSQLFLNFLGQNVAPDFTRFKLTPELRSSLECAEQLGNLPDVDVFGCNTIGNAYYFCAVESTPSNTLAEIGAGCSQDPVYALERAVSECAQCIGIVNGEELEEDRRAMQLFDQLPKLNKLAKLSVADFTGPSLDIRSNAELFDAFCGGLDDMSATRAVSPRRMLEGAVKSMNETGYDVFFCDTEVAGLGFVSRVYVPGLDRFHLIRSGLKVAPNSELLWQRC